MACSTSKPRSTRRWADLYYDDDDDNIECHRPWKDFFYDDHDCQGDSGRHASSDEVDSGNEGIHSPDEAPPAGFAMLAAGVERVTTLVIRRLPKETTREALMDTLDESGFKNLYDYVYVPKKGYDKDKKRYVFVNFVSSSHAASLTKKWQSRPQRLAPGEKMATLRIEPAREQGLKANLASSAEGAWSVFSVPRLSPLAADRLEIRMRRDL